jgi:glycerol uptake facilitator-like aquaporin
MAERMANGNNAIALLANAIATGAALVALIITFGTHSGAHFNPVVTLAEVGLKKLSWSIVPIYLVAQIIGAFVGVAAAHFMFELPLFTASEHLRTGPSQWFSEFVATFGLLTVILTA